MIRKLLSKPFFSLFVLTVILLFTACTSEEPQKESSENFIEYAIGVTEDIYTPNQTDFLMTVDEVLQTKDLEQSEVQTDQEGERIIITMTHPSLPNADDIKEIFIFEDNHLVTVQYFIFVDTELAHSLCDELYNQAKEHLGTPENDDPDFYLKRHSVRWEDEQEEQGNQVELFLTDNRNQAPAFDGKTCILLSIYISRDTFDNFFSETP